MIVATLAGNTAVEVAARFEKWRTFPDPVAVDRFCAAVRANALSLIVVYYTEWVDRWLMGDLVPGRWAVAGRLFEATCLTPSAAAECADGCGTQFPEQGWLAARLREAAVGWGPVADRYAIVIVREAIDVSATDEQVRAALDVIPAWLSPPDNASKPQSAPDAGRDNG